MRRDAGICSLRVHFVCVFLPFLFLWYVLISTFYFFASFHRIFVILDLYWRGMILQPSYDAKYLFFYSKCIYYHFFCTFSGKTGKKQEKCIILMYCLYESINKHNAVVTFFVHALAMFWDQNQKNRSEIDDVIILQNLDSKLKKMSITSKIPEISKISYKQKCLRICYYTQYWNFISIEWLVNMSTHEVHAPLKYLNKNTLAYSCSYSVVSRSFSNPCCLIATKN